MQYQLVVQFSKKLKGGFSRLIDIETGLDRILPVTSEIDGHDFGHEQMNIFILTDEPVEIFSKIKIFLEKKGLLSESKVAYRDIKKNNFVVLWPMGSEEFKVT